MAKERMPARIATLVANEDDSNSFPGVIPKLAHLLEPDKDLQVAYLCDQSAVQVHKLPNEGQFCGYRNIQMLCLPLGSNTDPTDKTRDALKTKLTIPRIQEMIEDAWDRDYNPFGRTLIGDLKGTTKYIGTSEAEALLLSLSIPCTGRRFEGATAWTALLDSIEEYYSASLTAKKGVHITSRPPIFLHRPGHSITVIGIERTASGRRCLLAFDPAWRPPKAMKKESLACAECAGWKAKWVLRQYRKSERYLRRWREFETLKVDQGPRVGCWR